MNFYGILFLILPLFSAFLAPLAGLVRPKHGTILNLLIYAAGAVMGIVLLTNLQGSSALILGGWRPPFGINLYLSPVSLGFGIVVYILALLLHVYDLGKGRSGRYNLLFSLFVFASLGMMQTGDLFNLFIFIEIGSIALIALVPSTHIRSGSRGALKYLVPSGLLSMFMLASIALLYSSLGTLNIAHVAQSGALNSALALLLGVGMLLMLFFESELFPLQLLGARCIQGCPVILFSSYCWYRRHCSSRNAGQDIPHYDVGRRKLSVCEKQAADRPVCHSIGQHSLRRACRIERTGFEKGARIFIYRSDGNRGACLCTGRK